MSFTDIRDVYRTSMSLSIRSFFHPASFVESGADLAQKDVSIERIMARKSTKPTPSKTSSMHVPAETKRAIAAVLLVIRSEEHTSELQSLLRSSYAVFCL